MEKPSDKPKNPCFSSGPCAKRPGWSIDLLDTSLLGRSHRSAPGKERLKEIIDLHKRLLQIPDDYLCGIVPASDTGGIEMAMWNLLGERGVNMIGWESFGFDWIKDVTEQLRLENCTVVKADYGELPDLFGLDMDNDTVFTWNGTTSGVRVPNGEWIPDDRQGLTLCDATSAVFAYELPWEKLDVTTWSWQKVMGSEAAHGMIVLSPRAVERLKSYRPDRPLPKIFRLTNGDKLIEGVFRGLTINTPSMLAVEDCYDSLKWIESIGGLPETIRRTKNNYQVIENWVERTDWVEFLAGDENARSYTSVTLKITDEWFNSELPEDEQMPFIREMVAMMSDENAVHDIASYKAAPAGLRIWCGTTVESSDLEILTKWVEWSYKTLKAEKSTKTHG